MLKRCRGTSNANEIARRNGGEWFTLRLFTEVEESGRPGFFPLDSR
jgi:hypothetical protein